MTLLTEKIITIRAFDAREASNSDGNRKSYGNNDWTVANIEQWLNSDAGAGAWYKAQHSADAPPTKADCAGYNGYDSQAGFLNAFTAQEKAALLETTLQIAGWSGNGTTWTGKVFFLSSNEVGLETIANNGTAMAYFDSANKRIAYPSAKAVANSDYTSVSTSSAWYWWLRNSYPSNSSHVRRVYADGSLYNSYACPGSYGVRPACNLSSNILVSDTTDGDGCYTVIYNNPPTAPGTITVPEEIKSTKDYQVTWTAANDLDGNFGGYILQRNLADAGWTQVYKGSARTYKDNLPYGTKTVQYRVSAYDSDNAQSAWTTSGKKTVINNRDPAISGNDSDLGVFNSSAPSLTYTVTDPDDDEVTVVESLDGQQLKSFKAQLGQSNTLTIDAQAWQSVTNGQHTFKVVATDENGASVTRTATFTKNITKIEFELAEPLPADEMPTKALINIQGNFPGGSTLQVMVCNNANDDAPKWEDATQQARNGQKFYFTNQTKTAPQWAFSVKVTAARGSASEPVYINSIGGNFG